MNTDRNLLFGAIAMQCGMITADQFAEACTTWTMGKGTSLSAICRDKGWLVPDDLTHIEYLVERRVTQCNGDIRASIAGCTAEVQSALVSIGSGAAGDILGMTLELHVDQLAGDVKAGQRYVLNKLHASGGIGEVWKARDGDLNREVAVKRLQPQMSGSATHKNRFLREARITGQLDHPGVVPIYELCRDELSGQPYYSMRFLSGRTLTEAVAKYHTQRKVSGSDSQTLLELLGAFSIICSTVAYAHSKGIIHRDLKCANVIVGDYGEVIVIDWGLAKELHTDDTALAHGDEPTDLAQANPASTLAGQILGTPAYMAPEQASGRLDLIGPATDVYGLSAILYEILTGQPPFDGRNTVDVLRKVLHEEPAPPSDLVPGIPEALEKICLKGLAKLAENRHASAERLGKAVHAWVSDLAERRQAEGERERFFALSLDLLAILDGDGRFRQISPAWERLLGYDSQTLVGCSFNDCLHIGDQASAAHWLETAVATGGAFEARALHRDGSFRWVSWNATPIAKERCVYIVGRDITDLKKSQQLFQGVLQSAPDAMVIIGQDGRIAMTNRQLEQVFGYTREEMLGQPIELLVPENVRAKHPTHVANFFSNPSVRPMGAGLILKGRRKDGREFPVDIAISPIMTEWGQLGAASVRDISELKKSQQLLEGVLQSAPDAMVIIGQDGRIVMTNRQLEKIFGYTQEEMLGQPIELLVPETVRARHPNHVANFFANPSVRPMGAGLILKGRRKDGREFPVDIAISPINTESGQLGAASVRDISDRSPGSPRKGDDVE